MSDIKPLLFNHSHHLLQVHGCNSLLDVLCFEGEENLSEPFRYTIEFTSSDHPAADVAAKCLADLAGAG